MMKCRITSGCAFGYDPTGRFAYLKIKRTLYKIKDDIAFVE